ncbi:hypothetical protein DM02DRAFT_618355 [Periconia macrospinosa]|uniref:Uncharacterized protein n=1 Tax=Periconia macrospinosa TaxID=97972 RepID=A0A2V1D9Q0_9PLEO|nr:hypothetical protein DM02DRAFT_618355 [Periconia macrospinosa]
MMALRRNPYRKCKRDDATQLATRKCANEWGKDHVEKVDQPPLSKVSVMSLLNEDAVKDGCKDLHCMASLKKIQRKPFRSISNKSLDPFPLLHLPRELRNHIYSYLVVHQGRRVPMLEAKSILREQKKRQTAQRTRERQNLKRIQTGRRPIASKDSPTAPIVDLTISQASRFLHWEASEYFYQSNWFAISMDNLPLTTIETPSGWDYSRITRLQLELQLKDAQRMNSYTDWAPFFAMFPRLRFLRIIPSFHPRYYDWAVSELADWRSAHYIFRAFFSLLLASIPEHLHLKLGFSLNPCEDMHLEGKMAVSKSLLWDMYAELGTRKDCNGQMLFVNQVVDCGHSFEKPIGMLGRCTRL